MDVVAYTNHPRPTPESRRDTGYIVPGTGDPDGSLPSAWYSGTDAASIDEFLGAGSARGAPGGPAILDCEAIVEPPSGFGLTTGSEALRESFGNRGDMAGLERWLVLRCTQTPGVSCEGPSTHPVLCSSGVGGPDESLLK